MKPDKQLTIVPEVEAMAALEPAAMPRLFELAVQKGPEGVEILERLVALDERMSKRRAEQEFSEALMRFKSSCPAIPRRTENSQFSVTRNGMKVARRYATLEDIEATVRGPLGQCGLSFRWGDSKMEGATMTLACIVSHVGGHSVSSSVTLPVESRAGCSEAQKYGAVMTYAQRYSLIQALGLTTCDEDTDGATDVDDSAKVSPDQVLTLLDLIDRCPPGTGDRLTKYISEKWGAKTLDGIPAARYEEIERGLKAKVSK